MKGADDQMVAKMHHMTESAKECHDIGMVLVALGGFDLKDHKNLIPSVIKDRIAVKYFSIEKIRQENGIETNINSDEAIEQHLQNEAIKKEHLKSASRPIEEHLQNEAIKNEHLKSASRPIEEHLQNEAIKKEHLKSASRPIEEHLQNEAIKKEHLKSASRPIEEQSKDSNDANNKEAIDNEDEPKAFMILKDQVNEMQRLKEESKVLKQSKDGDEVIVTQIADSLSSNKEYRKDLSHAWNDENNCDDLIFSIATFHKQISQLKMQSTENIILKSTKIFKGLQVEDCCLKR
jgi:hypothetical protein